MGKYYDHLIIAATTADLIRDGFLSPFTVYAPSNPDLSSVSTVAGDFHEGQLAEAMDRPGAHRRHHRPTWFKRGEDRPTCVFCVDRTHARHVAERFEEVGVAAEYMDGETAREDREATFERFRAGADARHRQRRRPGGWRRSADVSLPHRRPADQVAHPDTSRVIGRGLRPSEGKDKLARLRPCRQRPAARNSSPISIGTASTTARKTRRQRKQREQSEPLPKLCEACKAVVPIAAKACPACGAPVRALTTVQEVEGDLVELGSRRSGQRDIPEWERRRFYAELLGLAEERGYAAGWAAHKFKEKFAHWPNGYDRVAMEPSVSTRNWVKSRQIAFAKARGPPADGQAGQAEALATSAAPEFDRPMQGHPVELRTT